MIWQLCDDRAVRAVRCEDAKRKIKCQKKSWPDVCSPYDPKRCLRCYQHLDGIVLFGLVDTQCEQVCNPSNEMYSKNTDVEMKDGPIEERAWHNLLDVWFNTGPAPDKQHNQNYRKGVEKKRKAAAPQQRRGRQKIQNTHMG